MTALSISLVLVGLGVAVGLTMLDVLFERRQIERYLRVGGARILKFRWKPLLGWMGADNKSKHYEVTFEEHTGRVLKGIFTYTSVVGVMQTSLIVLRDHHAEPTHDDQPILPEPESSDGRIL
jgi:hypothetical protein